MSRSFDAVVETVLGHADGRVHLPVLPADDAEVLARGLHLRADALGDARADYGRAEEVTVACERGCSACCRVAVMVYEAEAIAVARWLRRPANAAVRKNFESRYSEWRAALGERIDRLVDRHAAGDFDAAEAIYSEISAQNVPCAFLRDGACSIYPVRPTSCRYFIALDTAEHCQLGSELGPKILEFPPYDEFVDKARHLLKLAQGVGGDNTPGPLCDRVTALLADPSQIDAVGRNDRCPCGSGRKYKRCCGR